jgi:predicted dehydrogenase
MGTTRRTFLKSGLAAGTLAATAAAPSIGAQGANDRIRIACIGLRGKGRSHIRNSLALKPEGVDLVALCDVDDTILQERAGQVQEQTGTRPDTYRDLRELLARDDIDAVTIATPNHWHALMTIWACQAGKDVYVEKPASWCVREGRQMVDAARKYGRIVQVGTQARSFKHVLDNLDALRNGLIGEVYMARGMCYKQRESLGFKPHTDPPGHIDYNLWLGPAPEQPYHANLVHYNWHWFWDFGCGDLGNQGVHEVDLARAVIGHGDLVRVSSSGGRFGYEDQGQTPNVQTTTWTYGDGKQITFEVRGRYTHAEHGVQIGNIYHGSEGYLPGANWGSNVGGYTQQDQSIADWKPQYGFDGQPYGGNAPADAFMGTEGELDEDYIYHFRNFVEAMRNRDHEHLNADILEGHRSAMLVHIANIAYRLGKGLTFDTRNEVFVGDGAAEANTYLTREYRAPFIVPDVV